MQQKANLQDMFLLRARRDRIPVTMFLMNGFQMRGTITGFDAFVVILDSDGRQQVLFTTSGNGHGVGMSQYGADGMGQAGFTYKEILQHYYSGVEVR